MERGIWLSVEYMKYHPNPDSSEIIARHKDTKGKFG